MPPFPQQQFLQSPMPQQAGPEQRALQGGKQGISSFMHQNQYQPMNNRMMNGFQPAPTQAPLINPQNAFNPPSGGALPVQYNPGQQTSAGFMPGGLTPGQAAGGVTQEGGAGPGGVYQGGLSNQWQNFINRIASQYGSSMNFFSQFPVGQTGQGFTNNVPTPTNTNPVLTVTPQTLNTGNLLTSDETEKENIQPAKADLRDFMQQIGAHNYTYKDQKHGVGQFTSPMAQELERTKLGKQAVVETPEGKMVDYRRLGGVNLAASSVLYQEQEKMKKQIDELQKQLSKRRK